MQRPAWKIRWLDHVCDTPEEAEEYISSHDKGNYDQSAVKFRDTNSIPTSSAKKKSLIKQIASYEEKKKLFDQAHSLANQKVPSYLARIASQSWLGNI